ncbi:MAG: hypothetical protein K9I84_04635 [Leadbetterella sp.]|nr:hypothetical protein [Leadbetterella sp.]
MRLGLISLAFDWLLVIGYWLLVIGYWLLVIGYWLLVIGYWKVFFLIMRSLNESFIHP